MKGDVFTAYKLKAGFFSFTSIIFLLWR